MNILLVVVDSLRARSLRLGEADRPRTSFLDGLRAEALEFTNAHATECWTLPTHLSFFTGLLPSEHGAHFQSMAYTRPTPTLAEHLARVGHHTEVVTRNSLFDGSIPGATRGFAVNTRLLASLGRGEVPFNVLLALGKPRVRRLLARSGFFNALQRDNRSFVGLLARLGLPADRLVLDHSLERMAACRRRGQSFFLFLNLYDVHAPYCPRPASPLTSFRTPGGWLENLSLPWVLPKISSHGYLRPGFRLSGRSSRMLLRRYHRAIELMDEKLASFWAQARAAHLFDDTLVILTSDHGEAFGDHGLYLHDGSVWQTHLHVPLWIRHPGRAAGSVDDVVSTRDLFHLMHQVGQTGTTRGTILDPATRRARPAALAEHFHYTQSAHLLPQYAQNIAAAIVGTQKLIIRREGPVRFDLARDPDELTPLRGSVADFLTACRRDGHGGSALAEAEAHLRRWETTAAAA